MWAVDRRKLRRLAFNEVDSIETDQPPFYHRDIDPNQTLYYRVIGLNGSRKGPASIVARSTVLSSRVVEIPAQVSPALLDINDDGCLDAVGAVGDCAGGFVGVDMTMQGTSGLLAPGRVNRDSRLADFNGDGFIDIFSNVYSRADDSASRAILHLNNGDNTFREDDGIKAKQLGGFGETILVADFDNDNDLDLFVPNYWHLDDGGRYWLLINDGNGGFRDVAAEAGVQFGIYDRPEGAQALDFNEDGWIDFYVASQLFINNGDLTFTDQGASHSLPVLFDEGLKFSDVDLDGDFDLVHHDRSTTRLFRNDNGIFDSGTIFNESTDSFGFGLNVCDINNDGFEDVVVANNSDDEVGQGTPLLFINSGGTFHPTDLLADQPGYNDLVVCADLNGDKNLDILGRHGGYKAWLNSPPMRKAIVVRVLGANGELNQQGRVVRVTPMLSPNITMTRVVESGSGYMAQRGYDLIVAAPWLGNYEISVRFADRWITARARSGDILTIYADGRSERSQW